MSSIKDAKAKLQDDLLDLISKFEEEYDVNVFAIEMQKERTMGDRIPRTTYVTVLAQV